MNNIESKFTAWMKVLVKRARLDYLRKKYIQSREIFFEDLEGRDTRYVLKQLLIFSEPSIDLFENEDILEVYKQLSDTQRSIIYRFYVREQTIVEISAYTGWSVNYIYNQKYLAIKKFRERLEGKKYG